MAASFDGRPRDQRLMPILFDTGDGSDGSFSSSGNVNFSAMSGVAADGIGVYVGEFTSFTLKDGHTITLDQERILLLYTGTVSLGGGTSGTVTGTGNGGQGGAQATTDQRRGFSGDGPGGGVGGYAQNDAGEQGGGGAGARNKGTDGTGTPQSGNPYGEGGDATNWFGYHLTGDTRNVICGAGGGQGGYDRNGVYTPQPAGDGGASLYIVAPSVVMQDGFAWTSNGNNGGTGGGGGDNGGGGGGAGGTIIVCARTIQIDATSGTVLSSTGGSGGSGTGGGNDGIGDKPFGGNHLFHHRMTPVFYQNMAVNVHFRPAIVILVGNFR